MMTFTSLVLVLFLVCAKVQEAGKQRDLISFSCFLPPCILAILGPEWEGSHLGIALGEPLLFVPEFPHLQKADK